MQASAGAAVEQVRSWLADHGLTFSDKGIADGSSRIVQG
jgi:hypothetical protein